MKITSALIFVLLFSASITTSIAQQNTTVLVPLPSIDDFIKGDDGWAFGLGLGVE